MRCEGLKLLRGGLVLLALLLFLFTPGPRAAWAQGSVTAGPPEPLPGLPDVRGALPESRESGPLPRPEQVARPQAALAESLHSYNVTHYRLDLTFPCVGTNLSGSCAISLMSATPSLGSVDLDFVSLNADSVAQDGVPAPYSVASGKLTVTLPRPLAVGDTTVIRVVYHGPAAAGYYQAYPETWFSFTEPSNARYWFPCYDQPWDKATSEIHATVPDTMFVASNGLQTAPVTVNAVAHTKTYHWGTQYPITTYLMSVAIAHYVQLSDSASYVPLRSYVLKADSVNAVYDFYRLPAMVNFFGSLWGQFPFEKYGMAATKDFGGGMEHQTMTTIARYWITGNRAWEWAISHELAHQWWGDMVTCLSWAHIWVNEGFASYSDILFREHTYGRDSAMVGMQSWAKSYFVEDSSASYPIYNPPSNHVFGQAIYYKGAWVLHMLRRVVGDSTLIRGWRNYGIANKYGNGSIPDFQGAIEAQYGGSLSWFFNQWIYDRGYPVYRVTPRALPISGGGYDNFVTLEQLQSGPPVFSMPVDLMLHTARGDSLVTVWDTQAAQNFDFPMAAALDSVTLDPNQWLLYQKAPPNTSTAVTGGAGVRALRFRSVTTGRGVVEFSFEVPDLLPGEQIELSLYDLSGRRVAVPLRRSAMPRGVHVLRWNGETGSGARAASGVYFARLGSDRRSVSSKVLWIR